MSAVIFSDTKRGKQDEKDIQLFRRRQEPVLEADHLFGKGQRDMNGKPKIFVAMPFKDELENVFYTIQQICDRNKYDVVSGSRARVQTDLH